MRCGGSNELINWLERTGKVGDEVEESSGKELKPRGPEKRAAKTLGPPGPELVGTSENRRANSEFPLALQINARIHVLPSANSHWPSLYVDVCVVVSVHEYVHVEFLSSYC